MFTAVAGRWTIEEHKLFLEGLAIHGKAWKKIATSIRTRSVTQVRTHAQKYFLKQSKGKKYSNDETQNSGDILPCAPHDLVSIFYISLDYFIMTFLLQTFPLQPSLQKRKLDDISTGIQSSAISKDWNSDFALFLDSSKLHPSEFSILGTCFETNPNLSSIANNDTRNLCNIPSTSNLPKVTVDIKAANISTSPMNNFPTKKLCVEKKGKQAFSPKSICNSLSFEDLSHHSLTSYGECANPMTSLYHDTFQNEENMLVHMHPNTTAIASVSMEDFLIMKDDDIYDDLSPNFLDHVTIDNFDTFFEYDHSENPKIVELPTGLNYQNPQKGVDLLINQTPLQFALEDPITDYYHIHHNSLIITKKVSDDKFPPCTTTTIIAPVAGTTYPAVSILVEETATDDDFSDATLSDYFSEDIFDNHFDCMFDYISE